MPAFSIGFLVVGAIYAGAAFAAAFVLTEQGCKRFVPVASVGAALLPWFGVWFRSLGLVGYFPPLFGQLVCPVLILYTLRLSWAGGRTVERILRVTAVALVGFAIVAVFLFGRVIS